ncbi:MAG: HNH endonuclease [Gemmatimonadota bacterium]
MNDTEVRTAAFEFLEEKSRLFEAGIPHRVLLQGFVFRGVRIPLLNPQGIFKPAPLDLPLTIRTAYQGPYEDRLGPDGLLRYHYRKGGPRQRDNVRLRKTIEPPTPLIYLCGIDRGLYAASWPAYILFDHRAEEVFYVALEDYRLVESRSTTVSETHDRAWVTRLVYRRLHQPGFRTRVLRAYEASCGVCRLRHSELLDATHILEDTHPRGDPIVPNGIALCKLHHAAYDGHILGIRPDLMIEVKKEVREEKDGPMLVHGLQGFHGETLCAPGDSRLRPDPDRLAERYEEFRQAS